jgi:hydrogenase expression/formation protein HypC
MCLAVPGRIEAIFERDGTRLGRVSFDGIIKEVCLEFLPEAGIGDYALVHVGFAITKIDEATAQASLATLRELGMLADELAEGPA